MADGNILVLDTETLGVNDRRVYNLGYVIADGNGNILKARDYLNKAIYDNNELMKSAYYNNKKSIYEARLLDGKCKKMDWSYILRILARDIKKYKVDGIYAYNSPFDSKSIAETCKVSNVKTNPTADGITDIFKGIVKPHLTETESYQEFCKKNGYLTKANRPSATAEIVYRFITQTDFVEEHTALADSQIELVILQYALPLSRA